MHQMQFGTMETLPKAFRVGPMFPPRNMKAAKNAKHIVAERRRKRAEEYYKKCKEARKQLMK